MMHISPVGDLGVRWGESVRWDERRGRLYFVDCAGRTLHWLERGELPLHSMALPGLPTGLVLASDGRLVVALDDGLHVIDPDTEATEMLAPYPDGLGGRANDARADLDGNLVTGTLNVAPSPGSYWWYSSARGWKKLDDGISNANGPVVVEEDGERTLVIADTHASCLYAYPYDGSDGTVGERRVFAQTTELGGMPDGACADARGGVWSCLFGGGKIVRFTTEGPQETIDAGMPMPSDVTFGGRDLDRMFFVSVAANPDAGDDGAPRVVDGIGHRGRVEPRFRL